MTNTYAVRHGGLMRCCLLALDDAMVAASEPPVEGDTLACRYCKTTMVFTRGAWMWSSHTEAPGQDATACE